MANKKSNKVVFGSVTRTERVGSRDIHGKITIKRGKKVVVELEATPVHRASCKAVSKDSPRTIDNLVWRILSTSGWAHWFTKKKFLKVKLTPFYTLGAQAGEYSFTVFCDGIEVETPITRHTAAMQKLRRTNKDEYERQQLISKLRDLLTREEFSRVTVK